MTHDDAIKIIMLNNIVNFDCEITRLRVFNIIKDLIPFCEDVSVKTTYNCQGKII